MKWISKAFYVVNVLVFFLMIASCLSLYLDPSSSQLLVLLGASFPIFLLLNCLFIFYWLVIEPKRIFLSIIALLVCFKSVKSLINYSGSSSTDKSGLSLLSYNIGGTFFLPYAEREERMKWIPKEISNVNPDIIAFQESSMVQFIKDDLLEYESHYFTNAGTSLFSKLPILDKGKLTFGGTINSGAWIDVKTGGQRIRIYSVHLQSNKISSSEIKALNDLNRNYEDNIKESRNVFSKYSEKSKVRIAQTKLLLEQIAKSPYPVVVLGDFNEPSFTYIYKKMTQNLDDSFLKKGSGLGTTLNGKIPFLRIDYAFVDKQIEVLKHEVLDWELSDHFPILVRVKS